MICSCPLIKKGLGWDEDLVNAVCRLVTTTAPPPTTRPPTCALPDGDSLGVGLSVLKLLFISDSISTCGFMLVGGIEILLCSMSEFSFILKFELFFSRDSFKICSSHGSLLHVKPLHGLCVVLITTLNINPTFDQGLF